MIFYCIIIFGILIDLVSKYFASIYLNEKINILGDSLYLFHIKNDGIAFSINIPFLKIITIVLILGIFYYYFKERPHPNPLLTGKGTRPKDGPHFSYKEKIVGGLYDISFGLILAGALGNGIERILYSQVTDFIAVRGFAVFNIADSYITIGALIYIYYLYTTGALVHKK